MIAAWFLRTAGARRVPAAVVLAGGLALVVLAALPASAFTDSQAHSGTNVYKHQCERCHGPNLEGKDDSFRGLRAPRLVGSDALPCKPRPYQKLRQHDFRTLKDVYDFVSATMPADQPASLPSQQYWDALAFVLQKNGRAADGKHLDEASSKDIVLHADCAAAAAKAQP